MALEGCGVCHSDGSFASASAAHAVTGVPLVSEVVFTDVAGDLQVTYNLLIDGVAAPVNDFLTVDSAYVYTAADGLTNTIDQVANPITIVGAAGGDFSATITGGTALAGTAGRFFLRLVNTAADTKAVVSGDFPAETFPAVVADAACNSCHGPAGVAPHTLFGYPGMAASQCVVCHKAEGGNPVFFPGGVADFKDPFFGIIHGIHNAHDFPDGFYQYDPADPETVFDTTYPTYMANCSVCHSEAAQLTAANSMTVSGTGCLSCHGDMENEYWVFTAVPFHLTNIPDPDTFDCATGCHIAGGLASEKVVVTDFHNGIETGNDGIIFGGVDTSVTEGGKFVWEITGVVDDGTNVAFTWQATYNNVGVDPCNATIGANAPLFHVGNTIRVYRNYAQGEDFILGQDTGGPGQPARVTLDATNTVCAGNVATTTIPVDDVDAERGRLALAGKPLVVSVLDPAQTMVARVPSPTFDWLVGDGTAAPDRRPVVDTADKCLACHVGSLYQHGGDRVDNVDMCLMCHNSASNEQSVRLAMGVDASEAYDGKVGETFELKTMLHRIHSAGSPGSPPYVIYRGRGIYAFAPDRSGLPNWPGEGSKVVYGSDFSDNDPTTPGDYVTIHNFHTPTYPRALNDCAACHTSDFAVIPDQTKAMATTVGAGNEACVPGTVCDWSDQLDDTLQGAATTACITCHKDGATKGHAYQNSWVPQVFPDGRQTIIDAVK